MKKICSCIETKTDPNNDNLTMITLVGAGVSSNAADVEASQLHFEQIPGNDRLP